MDAEQLLRIFSGQDFYDWYAEEDGPFSRYIQGDLDAPSRDEILADINRIVLRKRAKKVQSSEK